MDEVKLNTIANEIGHYVKDLKGRGHSKEEIRHYTLLSLDKTSILAFQDVAAEIAVSAEAGFNFVFILHQGLGGVNAVLAEEGIDLVHVTEIKFVNEVLIGAMEEYSGLKIDEILEQMEKMQAEQEGNEQ